MTAVKKVSVTLLGISASYGIGFWELGSHCPQCQSLQGDLLKCQHDQGFIPPV